MQKLILNSQKQTHSVKNVLIYLCNEWMRLYPCKTVAVGESFHVLNNCIFFRGQFEHYSAFWLDMCSYDTHPSANEGCMQDPLGAKLIFTRSFKLFSGVIKCIQWNESYSRVFFSLAPFCVRETSIRLCILWYENDDHKAMIDILIFLWSCFFFLKN